MNRATVGILLALACVVAWPATGQPVEASPAVSGSTALPVAVDRARQAVERQRARNLQLQQRVDALRQQQDQARQQLQQRDRTLQALRRQIDRLSPPAAASTIRPQV